MLNLVTSGTHAIQSSHWLPVVAKGCYGLDDQRPRLGCKWSLVQIQSPRPFWGRDFIESFQCVPALRFSVCSPGAVRVSAFAAMRALGASTRTAAGPGRA